MAEQDIEIGVIDSDDAISDMTAEFVSLIGYKVAVGREEDFLNDPQKYDEFLREHKPRVVLLDVPPFKKSWELIKSRLIDNPLSWGISFILTSTRKESVESYMDEAGRTRVLSKPFNFDELAEAIDGCSKLKDPGVS